MDYLTHLYSQHSKFFDRLDFLMKAEVNPDWVEFLDEPDDEFMAQSDANAEELLLDLLGDDDE